MQVTRQRVRHSRTRHHRFIGVLGGCTEPKARLHRHLGESIHGCTYTLTVRSERERSHWFVKLVECELGADGVIMEDFRLANIEEMEHAGGGVIQGSWKYGVEDTTMGDILDLLLPRVHLVLRRGSVTMRVSTSAISAGGLRSGRYFYRQLRNFICKVAPQPLEPGAFKPREAHLIYPRPGDPSSVVKNECIGDPARSWACQGLKGPGFDRVPGDFLGSATYFVLKRPSPNACRRI